MSQDKADVDVSDIDFMAIARDAISVKLAETLTGSNDIVTKIVTAALAQKVNIDGSVDRHGMDHKQSYVEWLAHELIRESVHSVLKDKIDELRPVIEKIIEARVMALAPSIAELLTDDFVNRAKQSSSIKFDIIVSSDEVVTPRPRR